jgi:N-acetylglucosamine malate deacetylase 1
MADNKRALALMAHPDDAEFTCCGTLALLHQRGWEIHLATMTPGDCGSEQLGPEEISEIRRVEAANSAAVLGGTYRCLECRDGFIAYDRETTTKAVALIRKVRPAVVFAMSPSDYLIDHEVASAIVRNAAFFAGVPNLKTEPFGPFRPVPHVYYGDPVEAKDIFGRPVEAPVVVDITSVVEIKSKMLGCHASQREWLLKQHGLDEYIHAMLARGEQRGRPIGAKYAEGFRQHLGHGYPQDDLLAAELGSLVHCT